MTSNGGVKTCSVVLGELARLAARRDLEVPIARAYPLERVREFSTLGGTTGQLGRQ
jgi:hypothetical protein